MDYETKYNTKIPAVKRLMREACELKEPTEDYSAHPLDDNLFEWHFTVRGASGTSFEGGVYHGRILLPNEYPMKPPNIILLTPNGRFETNKKICLSISGHHPETWQPSWSIRTALLALIAFMPTRGEGTIGALDYTPEERKALARKSQAWECQQCGPIASLLGSSAPPVTTQDETQMIKNAVFKAEQIVTSKKTSSPSSSATGSSESAKPSTQDSTVPNSGQTQLEADSVPSQGGIASRTADLLIAIIFVAIAILVYRRMYLL